MVGRCSALGIGVSTTGRVLRSQRLALPVALVGTTPCKGIWALSTLSQPRSVLFTEPVRDGATRWLQGEEVAVRSQAAGG